MPSFDPATVRQAVAEFTPRRPEKFQDLMPAKEVIVPYPFRDQLERLTSVATLSRLDPAAGANRKPS